MTSLWLANKGKGKKPPVRPHRGVRQLPEEEPAPEVRGHAASLPPAKTAHSAAHARPAPRAPKEEPFVIVTPANYKKFQDKFDRQASTKPKPAAKPVRMAPVSKAKAKVTAKASSKLQAKSKAKAKVASKSAPASRKASAKMPARPVPKAKRVSAVRAELAAEAPRSHKGRFVKRSPAAEELTESQPAESEEEEVTTPTEEELAAELQTDPEADEGQGEQEEPQEELSSQGETEELEAQPETAEDEETNAAVEEDADAAEAAADPEAEAPAAKVPTARARLQLEIEPVVVAATAAQSKKDRAPAQSSSLLSAGSSAAPSTPSLPAPVASPLRVSKTARYEEAGSPAVKILRLSPDAKVPEYQTEGSAGADVSAFLEDPLPLLAGRTVAIPTGLKVEIPPGWEVQVRPRSGLALNHALIVPNAPGTIDSDYRGELKIILMNLSHTTFVIEPGMRIAQLVLARSHRATFEVTDAVSETVRGEGGFGSTGVSDAAAAEEPVVDPNAVSTQGSATPQEHQESSSPSRSFGVPGGGKKSMQETQEVQENPKAGGFGSRKRIY